MPTARCEACNGPAASSTLTLERPGRPPLQRSLCRSCAAQIATLASPPRARGGKARDHAIKAAPSGSAAWLWQRRSRLAARLRCG